jgi:hypothetical protein
LREEAYRNEYLARQLFIQVKSTGVIPAKCFEFQHC